MQGFGPEVREVIKALASKASPSTTLLVSATMTKAIKRLMEEELPGMVRAGCVGGGGHSESWQGGGRWHGCGSWRKGCSSDSLGSFGSNSSKICARAAGAASSSPSSHPWHERRYLATPRTAPLLSAAQPAHTPTPTALPLLLLHATCRCRCRRAACTAQWWAAATDS